MGSLVLIVAAVVYFVNPFDLVPDGVPLAGQIDDAAVIAFVGRQVEANRDRFRAWKVSRGTTATN